MCRLAYIPRPFAGMAPWLERMERTNGGHGAGLATGTRLVKGRDFDAKWTGEEIMRYLGAAIRGHRKMLPCLWHTRLTSSGGHHDELCHPFPCDKGFLVHNGHWGAFHVLAQEMAARTGEPMSDTKIFSLLVDGRGFEWSVLEMSPPGVWLHMRYDGKLAVWKSGGNLWYCPRLRVWGSEPADEWGWIPVQDGLYRYGEPARIDRSYKPEHQPFLFRTGSL